ncbi:hypothetical protein [Armatimonas sp.]|uniref:hypothetical protein n=1 Tax=Armatimonas sp. TaxID=1872638 RepID=UPI00374FE274
MRFNTLAVVSLIFCGLSAQPVQAQGWVFDPLTIEDVSLPDPTPFIAWGDGYVGITSESPSMGSSPLLPGVTVGQANASLVATGGILYSIIYASTFRAGIIKQRCIYSGNNAPPTIKSNEGFVWNKSSTSPGYSGVSFGGFQPTSNVGMMIHENEYNPAYAYNIDLSSYSSTFILEGSVTATAAVYGLLNGSTSPKADAVRWWISEEGDNPSNGTG